tara:strand:- start:939 stop:1211 length:273 start_codon:yes stop_codon:yes gene_type:complete
MTLNKSGKPRKKGSGRTAGSTSFVEVSLRELNRVLKEDAVIIIGRKYAEALRLDSKKVESNVDVIESVTSAVELKTADLTVDDSVLELDF